MCCSPTPHGCAPRICAIWAGSPLRSSWWRSGVAVLALALLAYLAALAVHGNGFVAGFCGGIAFGAAAGRRGAAELAFLKQTGSAVSLLVWLAFGAIAVPIALDHIGWAVVVYAVLSLTVVRMVPVALALIGSGMDRDAVLFIGWFGPRGLASLVFALLALEEIGPGANETVAVSTVTVLLSVLGHGLSAAPLAARYAAAAARGSEPGGAVPDLPVRGRPPAGHRSRRGTVAQPGSVSPAAQ
jgi:sodium/hydrogen antiporter